MPRFNLKSLLIAVAIIAIWLPSFAYGAGHDVCASLLLLLFVGSGLAALFLTGRQRAFWTGFFAVMLIAGSGATPRYVPELTWLPPNGNATEAGMAMNPDGPPGLVKTYDGNFAYVNADRFNAYLVSRDPMGCTIQTLTMLALSALAGLIGLRIYDHRRPEK